MSKWKDFTDKELNCQCCGKPNPNPEFITLMDRIQQIRNEYGKPMNVTSGYRCENHPLEVDKEGGPGEHNRAAVDINTWGEDAVDLLELALDHDITGIGIRQKGDYDQRIIHLDLRDKPWIWSY